MSKTIPMPQIIEQLTALIGCSEEVARTFLEEFASQVTVGLRDRGVVIVKDIGTFRRVEGADGATTCEFAPSRELAEAVNAPFSMFEAVELDEEVTVEMLDRAARVAPDESLEIAEDAEVPTEVTVPVEAPAERQSEAPIETPIAEAPPAQPTDEPAVGAEESVEVPEVEVVTVEVASEVTTPTPTPASAPVSPISAPVSETSPEPTPVIAPVAAPASVPPPIPSKEEGKPQLPPIPINRGERSSQAMPQPQRRSVESHDRERPHEGHRHEHRRGNVPPPMPRMKGPRRVTLSSLVATALLALIAGAAIGYFAYSQLNLEGVKSVNISAEDVQVIHAQPADSVAVDTVKAVLAPAKEASDTTQRADAAKSATQPHVANVATAAAPAAVAGAVTDTVRAGYFLTTMAQRHYGKKKFWVYIYLENREKLGNPDHIKPNTVVAVPPAEKYGIKPGDKASEADAERKSAEIIATYSK